MRINQQALYQTIDEMNPEELAQLRQYIDQRMVQPPVIDEDAATRIAAIQEALVEIRSGLSEAELDKIIEAMNSEYIEPIGTQYDWLDDEEKK